MTETRKLSVAADEYFVAYGVGFVCASVCTNLDDKAATERLNWEHPTGVHPWFVSEDKTFKGGEPMPCPCPDRADCRHILFNC